MMEHASLTIAAGARAFGDGSHPTTLGVLTALEGLQGGQFAPRIACDMGAGSGIVAFAAATRFGCPVIAAELERAAVQTLQENLRANGMTGRITPVHSDGFNHPAIAAAAPYDLITMNILAAPLMRLAADAQAMLAPGGVAILSGMLQWQEPQIREAYQALGLELSARLTLREWVTLSFQKP